MSPFQRFLAVLAVVVALKVARWAWRRSRSRAHHDGDWTDSSYDSWSDSDSGHDADHSSDSDGGHSH